MFVIGLIILVVGVSYAAYTFTGTGTKENVITTGQIKISFEEQNNITIRNRYPETDAEGLANIDSNSTMNFTVTGEIKGEATVEYAIGLDAITEGATLTQDYVKIYLTKNGNVATGFNENVGRTIKSFAETKVENYLESHVIAKGVITGTEVESYTLKAWIDEDYNLPITDISSGKVHSSTTSNEEFSFKIKVVGVQGLLSETSGANAPELAENMIPVTYNGTTWVKADSTNSSGSWYNYGDKKWANAVTVTNTNRETYLKASVGTPINMDDINTMWVWIPRFSATKNTLDCSTLVNPTKEKYPQCYANFNDTDKQKVMGVLQAYGDPNPELTLNYLLAGESITLAGMTGNLEQVVEFYNSEMAPDSISINYDTLVSNRIVTGNNGGTGTSPGAFNIDFTSIGEKSHEAFTFDNNELAGIWVGKFETSHTTLSESTNYDTLNCTNESCENAKGLTILPNVLSLTRNNVSSFFYAGRSMEQSGNLYGLNSSEVDTHMMKNPEWGAVAYLTQSIYGRCTDSISCSEIGINNYGGYILNGYWGNYTGYGAPAGSDYQENDDEFVYVAPQAYNTSQGMDASTTGNIYGIYDMSGGAYEYVMGVYTDGTYLYAGNNTSNNSGFNGCTAPDCSTYQNNKLDFPDNKYYNSYTTPENYINAGLQHALVETAGWYGNATGFVSADDPWFGRGGGYNYPGNAGVFAFNRYLYGIGGNDNGFRAVLVK